MKEAELSEEREYVSNEDERLGLLLSTNRNGTETVWKIKHPNKLFKRERQRDDERKYPNKQY